MRSVRVLAIAAVTGALFLALAPHAKRARKKRVKGPEVCATFRAAVVDKALGAGFAQSASRYAPLCSWSRDLPDAEARQQAYNQQMQAWTMAKVTAMQKRTEAPPMPKAPRTTDTVSVSWRGDAKTPAAAKAQLASAKRTLTEGITVSATGSAKRGFKTRTKIGDKTVDDREANAEANEAAKDLAKGAPGADREVSVTRTIQADVEDVAGVGDGAFWNPKHRALTVVKGKRLFTVTVDVEEKDAKALAIELARAWM